MNKVIDRVAWANTQATTMVEDNEERVHDLLCIFMGVTELFTTAREKYLMARKFEQTEGGMYL